MTMQRTWSGNSNTVRGARRGLVANLPADDAGSSGAESVDRAGLGIFESPVDPPPFVLPRIETARFPTRQMLSIVAPCHLLVPTFMNVR